MALRLALMKLNLVKFLSQIFLEFCHKISTWHHLEELDSTSKERRNVCCKGRLQRI